MIKYNDLFQKNIAYWGNASQNILKNSSILIAGCGGLGSVVSSNLIRSGIGKLILIDYEQVEISNLNRQIFFEVGDIGDFKTRVTKERLKAINPFCKIEILDTKLSENTDLSSLKFNGVADCLDNYKSRFILEKQLDKNSFLVHGGISLDFGQITTIIHGKSKSLEEIFKGVDSFNNNGILPQIVNIIGSLMSHEIINNLIKKPQLLNRILVFELEDFSINFINLN